MTKGIEKGPVSVYTIQGIHKSMMAPLKRC